jgi:hypothetical protein
MPLAKMVQKLHGSKVRLQEMPALVPDEWKQS